MFTILTIFDNFHNSDNCFCHFDNWKDNAGELWYLRQWLQFRQLRTWIHDNLCYLTINCDTGQHSQFLRCFMDNGLQVGIWETPAKLTKSDQPLLLLKLTHTLSPALKQSFSPTWTLIHTSYLSFFLHGQKLLLNFSPHKSA